MIIFQALNNLAVIDDNKMKIVESGALPHYVKILSEERDESVLAAAAEGLWSLAFKCKEKLNEEPGCLQGRHLFTVMCAISKS